MKIDLRPITLPDFGVPLGRPAIPPAIYAARADEAYARAGGDWLVVYADREHLANIAFLTGFEPRFEEALLLLGRDRRRILVTGNESQSYAPLAGLPGIEIVVAQSMSLMGQDRTRFPNLENVLREAGLAAGQTIALVGWKYLSPEEWSGTRPTFQVPAFIVDTLAKVAGGHESLKDETPVLMHPETGLRASVDIHQIAQGEWGAARASAAVWRIIAGSKPDVSEYEQVARMGYAGEELSAHVMYATASRGEPVVGLRSPSARPVRRGDGVATAVSYWGGLSARAGLFAEKDADFLSIAKAYFGGLLAWYEAVDIGVQGGTVFEAVREALARGALRSALNPGHLVGHDEWIHTPVRPGSADRLLSGMPFQVDIIPTPLPDGWALNCEDAVTLADEKLRGDLAKHYPDVANRITGRRRFMQDKLGVSLKDSIQPLSSTPLCLPPFWLACDQLLCSS